MSQIFCGQGQWKNDRADPRIYVEKLDLVEILSSDVKSNESCHQFFYISVIDVLKILSFN